MKIISQIAAFAVVSLFASQAFADGGPKVVSAGEGGPKTGMVDGVKVKVNKDTGKKGNEAGKPARTRTRNPG
jgi:hypothetical protein